MYTVWKTNKFNDDLLVEQVATFEKLEFAKDFVDYQAAIGESYAVLENNERIYPID